MARNESLSLLGGEHRVLDSGRRRFVRSGRHDRKHTHLSNKLARSWLFSIPHHRGSLRAHADTRERLAIRIGRRGLAFR